MADETLQKVARVDDLVNEAWELSRESEERWNKNHRMYAGDQFDTNPPEGLEQYTINMTKRAVDQLAAVMTEQRPRVALQPTESNEPAIYYLPENGVIAAELQKAGEVIPGITDEQLVGNSSIDEDQLQALMPLIDSLVEAGQLNPDELHRIDDQEVTSATDTVLQTMWGRGNWDIKLQDGLKNALITGHQGLIIEWDDDKQLMTLKPVHYKQIGMDPNAFEGDMDEADYFTYLQPMSMERAIRKFPDHEASIRAHAHEGRLDQSGTKQNSLGGVFDSINYKRKMITLKAAFERTEEGKIKRTRVIAGQFLDEVETPFRDLPIVWLINIPQPFRPYGIGEPEVLQDVQDLINRLFSIHGNHTKYFQSPQSMFPSSMVQAMGGNLKSMHSHPGKAYEIPDDLYHTLGSNPKIFIDPPTMQNSYTNFLGMMIDIFKSLSGDVDVLGGEIPSADTSGKAIQTLQTAARGTIGYRSLWLESALDRMVKICLGLISDVMKDSAWEKYTNKYPKQVLKSLRQKAKETEFDVQVEVVSGKGADRSAKKEEALLLFDRGAITLPALHEIFEVQNSDQQVQELQAQAQAAAEAEAAEQGA